MTKPIIVLDRITKKTFEENVYGRAFIEAFYGKPSKLSAIFLPLFAGYRFFSWFYGLIQKSPLSQKKVKPFIEKFGVDEKEFLLPIDSFKSFNDFFIRKLKQEARPIVEDEKTAILPADGRYLVYPNIEEVDGFVVKGKKFCLKDLFLDQELAKRYEKGSMVIARLCPTDYHRFHFPCDCTPSKSIGINGDLHSVNPLALRRRIEILSHNKRAYTLLDTKHFGQVAFIEIGAMCVGSIHDTYTPNTPCKKGDEKGYFSFGGSSLILLFEPGTIIFDEDLVLASKEKMEVLGLMGQSLGRSF